MSHTHPGAQPDDKKAAFAGLIVTAVALFVIAYSIVLWTNSRFEGHEKGGSAAESTH